MKSKSFLESFIYAVNGLKGAFTEERNFRTHILLGVLILLFGFALKLSNLEFILLIGCIFSVLSAELFNTAIELVVDLFCGDKYFELAKRAKDTAAAGTLVCVFGVSIIGFLLFFNKIINDYKTIHNIFSEIKVSIIFFVAGIIVFVLNNKNKIVGNKKIFANLGLISDFLFSVLAFTFFFLSFGFTNNIFLLSGIFITAFLIVFVRNNLKFEIYSLLQNLSAIFISFFLTTVLIKLLIK